MNRIFVALARDNTQALEYYLNDYNKEVIGFVAYIQFNCEDWNAPNNVFSEDIMNHLFNIIKDFAFIRLGDAPGDVEYHGDLETFNLKIQTQVEYGE